MSLWHSWHRHVCLMRVQIEEIPSVVSILGGVSEGRAHRGAAIFSSQLFQSPMSIKPAIKVMVEQIDVRIGAADHTLLLLLGLNWFARPFRINRSSSKFRVANEKAHFPSVGKLRSNYWGITNYLKIRKSLSFSARFWLAVNPGLVCERRNFFFIRKRCRTGDDDPELQQS